MGTRVLTPVPEGISDILVTGGTGFYGRALIRSLASTARPIRVLSRSGSQSRSPAVRNFRGDVTDPDDVATAMRGCDAVFHCAAEKHDTATMKSVNMVGTRVVFDLARELGVKYLCHLSSVGVIGRARQAVIDEKSPCHPMNLYEETKLAAEQIVERGLPNGRVVILRPTNIFGPDTLRSLLRDSIRDKLARFLKGNESAHLVYVEDVAAAASYCWQNTLGARVESYIVSSDEEGGVTHREIQAALSAIVPAPRPPWMAAPRAVPYLMRVVRHGNANLGDIIYSSRKLRESGFRFPYGLYAGLRDAAGALQDSIAARR